MTIIPNDAAAYKKTQVFTPKTVPQSLLAIHRTKAGIWGRIDVLAGTLNVSRFADTGETLAEEQVPAGAHAIVAPQEPHAVAFTQPGEFTVTFYKQGVAKNYAEKACNDR